MHNVTFIDHGIVRTTRRLRGVSCVSPLFINRTTIKIKFGLAGEKKVITLRGLVSKELKVATGIINIRFSNIVFVLLFFLTYGAHAVPYTESCLLCFSR